MFLSSLPDWGDPSVYNPFYVAKCRFNHAGFNHGMLESRPDWIVKPSKVWNAAEDGGVSSKISLSCTLLLFLQADAIVLAGSALWVKISYPYYEEACWDVPPPMKSVTNKSSAK